MKKKRHLTTCVFPYSHTMLTSLPVCLAHSYRSSGQWDSTSDEQPRESTADQKPGTHTHSKQICNNGGMLVLPFTFLVVLIFRTDSVNVCQTVIYQLKKRTCAMLVKKSPCVRHTHTQLATWSGPASPSQCCSLSSSLFCLQHLVNSLGFFIDRHSNRIAANMQAVLQWSQLRVLTS